MATPIHSALPARTAEVLVVGAGPTGLTMAAELARCGVGCRLIDRAPTPSDKSRAIAIQARTLELFEQRGVVEPFLRAGHRGRAVNLYSGGRRLVHLDFDPLDTRYPYLLFLDQSETERILDAEAGALGVVVERGVELVRVDQDVTRVNATLGHLDGRREEVAADFLVGCDGAHSAVRHALGLGFAGKTIEQTFLLADLRAESPLPEDEFHVFASDEGLTALFPMGGGRHRLVADSPPAPGASGAPAATAATAAPAAYDAPAPSLEECRAIVERRTGVELRLTDLAWSSYFHVNSRMVERLRVGRAFVAGDAAHIHSPAGGQGMNTGIQEAINLAWKLALVLRGRAPERILDSYDAERHPIERDVLMQTEIMTSVVGAEGGLARRVRDLLAPVVTSLGPVRTAARRAVSELAVHYRRSPLSEEHVLDGGARAGERAPDALAELAGDFAPPADRGEGGPRRLFDLLDPAAFTLLVLLERGSDGSFVVETMKRTVARWAPVVCGVWGVTDPGAAEGAADAEGGLAPLAANYGRTRPSVYLVRPDGYVAFRGHAVRDAEALAKYCERWLTGE
jgi:2-polyprenyl-6-methoxyphenol hydroxylase-like FAD-dependent oxidoreductase